MSQLNSGSSRVVRNGLGAPVVCGSDALRNYMTLPALVQSWRHLTSLARQAEAATHWWEWRYRMAFWAIAVQLDMCADQLAEAL